MSFKAFLTATAFGVTAVYAGHAAASKVEIPAQAARLLPPHYDVLGSAAVDPGAPGLRFYVVALGREGESSSPSKGDAPARPLLILRSQGGYTVLAGRNDTVVLKADEGGQCDPFLDSNGEIAAKGRYFTVENGVACGSHWTDYITFRFDPVSGGFVFDNERSENWVFNPSQDENAEALVRDGPQVVRRPPRGRTVSRRSSASQASASSLALSGTAQAAFAGVVHPSSIAASRTCPDGRVRSFAMVQPSRSAERRSS